MPINPYEPPGTETSREVEQREPVPWGRWVINGLIIAAVLLVLGQVVAWVFLTGLTSGTPSNANVTEEP